MENYKIKVANEAERSESTNLLKELGFFRRLPEGVVLRDFVCTDNDGEILYSNIDDNEKELTLPQLKDLVLLKRNDVGDATHVRGDGKKYFHAQSTDYFYQFSDDEEWVLSTWMNYQLLAQLQPIEPKMSILDTGRLEMKEFLVKSASDGSYSLVTACASSVADGIDAIEVPMGADIAALGSKSGKLVFYKDGGESQFDTGSWYECGMVINGIEHKNINYFLASGVKNKVVWQRHTHPEELPFTDEPSLHVQYETPENKAKIVNAIESAYATKSLNDQYAEIEKVRQANNETEFLMQGANGERLKASIEEFKNTDHGVEFDNFNLLPEFDFTPTTIPRTASEIADASLVHIKERARTYDQQGGERSAAKTAQAFNAITGKDLNEADIWHILCILKMVRQCSRDKPHVDSYEDLIAYSALWAESLEKNL